jgi:hypothetical protein
MKTKNKLIKSFLNQMNFGLVNYLKKNVHKGLNDFNSFLAISLDCSNYKKKIKNKMNI